MSHLDSSPFLSHEGILHGEIAALIFLLAFLYLILANKPASSLNDVPD
jgi:hypothetical protein